MHSVGAFVERAARQRGLGAYLLFIKGVLGLITGGPLLAAGVSWRIVLVVLLAVGMAAATLVVEGTGRR
jgi:hypothetical protein